MSNAMTRWNPVASSLVSREPFFRMVDSLFNEFVNGAGEDLASRAWMPAVDIQETEDAYRLDAELPGLTKDDIQITLENNVLRLSGERKLEKDVKRDNYHRVERTYGTFSRSFALPSQVNAEGVQATFENGVLTLTVPKSESAKPRRIAIS
ncbi:MAG TPA: Hsp20/alpha crystallin family protein [Thermoanaerobaculia bacterium]|nr:Hsp20/alpha crystallin family protein [Thermoanaerobaculia bacterium]